MRLAILGTRGIPASYGGFETFAEELSWRLAGRGHELTVYCRSHHTPRHLQAFRGVRLVVLPTIRHKYLDTIAHTFFSSLHALRESYDAVLLCNAANSVFLTLLKLSGIPAAINVDGLEWKRKKWSNLGKWYYRLSERIAARLADAVVSDARVIERYYQERFGRQSVFIPYGAPTEKVTTVETLERYDLEPGRYLLYVSRFEPENNAHQVLAAFGKVDSDFRLVMVGDAPYARGYVARLKEMADPRVIFTGYLFGKAYRELMSQAYCYIHATEVGGSHPALLEAMGLGNGVLASDTPENREVADEGAIFFSLSQAEDLTEKIRLALAEPELLDRISARARERVRALYRWDAVADAYEALFESLVKGAAGQHGREFRKGSLKNA